MRAAFLAADNRPEEAAKERSRAGEAPEVEGVFTPVDEYFQARMLEATGDAEGAISALSLLIENTGADRAVLFFARRRRGNLRLARGDTGGALEDYVGVRALGGESPLLLIKLARCWRRLGEEDRAENLLRRAIDSLREGESAEDWSWACELARGYPPYLRRVVQAGLECHPEDPGLHVCLGVSLNQQGHADKALEEYK